MWVSSDSASSRWIDWYSDVGIATGKVATGGSEVGCEQDIAHEQRRWAAGWIADQIGRVGRCMAGNVQYPGLQRTDAEDLSVNEQAVKRGGLAFLPPESASKACQYILHPSAGGNLPAKLALEDLRT